jgi:branched-chain amino acid transport system ATP-binding protein
LHGSGAVVDILSADRLTKKFGGLTAVNEVSLQIVEGAVEALIGPNGAGKTTLFNMLTGAIKPTAGTVTFDGQRISGLPEHRIVALGIGRTFQHTALFPTMTVLENVMVGVSCRMHVDVLRIVLGTPEARREERQARQIADGLLEFVGIAGLRNRLARELSYGDARRTAIARAMAASPRMLMLDEPAAGMNTSETMRLIDLIRAINARGVTVLVIEHNMDFIMNLADRITVLDHGNWVATGNADEVRRNPQVIEAYLGATDSRAPRRHRRLRES